MTNKTKRAIVAVIGVNAMILAFLLFSAWGVPDLAVWHPYERAMLAWVWICVSALTFWFPRA